MNVEPDDLPDETSWVDDEPGFARLRMDLARIARRAMKRPVLVVAIVIAGACLAVASRARVGRQYTASVVLRITESTMDLQGGARLPRHLREHLLDTVLSKRRLSAIIRARDLHRNFAKTDMTTAVAMMREDLSIEVVSNYFRAERVTGDPPRSVRVILEYRSGNAELATTIAQDLAQAVTEEEAAQRTVATVAAADAVTAGLGQLRERFFVRREELVAARRELADGSRSRIATARVERLSREVTELENQMLETERQRSQLELMARAEGSGLGLIIDRAHEGLKTRGGGSLGGYVAIFLIVCALLFPSAMLGVGAFDGRVHERSDIERLGLDVVVELPKKRRGSRP